MATTYQNLINVSGTIFDINTGKGYASPTQLAGDLGISANSIDWSKIPSGPITSVKTLSPDVSRFISNLFGQTVNGVTNILPGNTINELINNGVQVTQQSGTTQKIPQALTTLGISPEQTAQYNRATSSTTYKNLVNVNGTIYNAQTGKGYATPQELASELGVQTNQINWGAIQQRSTPPVAKATTQTTGDPKYDQLRTVLLGYLDELHKIGQVVNPNVTLTPEQLAEFTAKAQAQVSPYYASQLKLARETLLRSQGYNTDEILRSEQDLERKYGQSVRQIGSNAADQGFALSGARQLDEQNLATDTQSAIDTNRRKLAFAGGNDALNFAKTYGGSADIPNVNIDETPQVLAGQTNFNRSGRQLPFYSISPSLVDGLIGTQQNEQKQAVDTLSSQLASNYTTQQANNQLRSLTI